MTTSRTKKLINKLYLGFNIDNNGVITDYDFNETKSWVTGFEYRIEIEVPMKVKEKTTRTVSFVKE